MFLARAAWFSLVAFAECGSATPSDEAPDIAIVGGGVAGTVTALEFLKRNKTNQTFGSLTIFEHGPSLGHNKSASGIGAILAFASIHKYWYETLPFVKLQEFLALRVEVPRARYVNIFDEYLYGLGTGDTRMKRETQERFFHESRMKMEEMLDTFPELCGAVVGPFCCRNSSEARRWMENESNQARYNVSCEVISGVAHVFIEKNDAICDMDMAEKHGLEFCPSETAGAACQGGHSDLPRRGPAVDLLVMEQLMRENLFAGLWNSADEGFVRVEEFYPIAQEIFKRNGINVRTSCSVLSVQPEQDQPSRQPKVRVRTNWSCPQGQGGTFDRVIVAAGANTVTVLAQHDRRIASQILPVKGFAVKTDAPLLAGPLSQIGLEHEDLGQYIHVHANGGVCIGFGQEIGIFDDQLLDPTFEGWNQGTGPNATGLGREILAHDHVGLAGFRPVTVYGKFPLIKHYLGQWSGLFVNTGFGFYGYGMAWKSAELTADLVLGVQPKGWDGTWERDEGPLICTRVPNVFAAGVMLCALLAFWLATRGLCRLCTNVNEQPQAERYQHLDFEWDCQLLDRVLFRANCWIYVHFGCAFLACFLAFLGFSKSVFLVMGVKAAGAVWLQCGSSVMKEDLDALRLPIEDASLFKLWLICLVVADSADQEADGSNAGHAMLLHSGLFESSAIANRVMWAENHYEQQWECVPYFGWLVGWLGPYKGLWVHFFIFTSLQACSSILNMRNARDQLAILQSLRISWHVVRQHCEECNERFTRWHENGFPPLDDCNSDESSEWLRQWHECNAWFLKWNELWRRSVQAFDMCGLQVAGQIAAVWLDAINLALEERKDQARALQLPPLEYPGRYLKLQVLVLKVTLESGVSLVLLTTTAAVTLDFLPTAQVLAGAVGVLCSTASTANHIFYQLTRNKDVMENLTKRWFGWLGFISNRLIVVMLGMLLAFCWVKVVGLAICKSHVLDLTSGCVDFSPETVYSLGESKPAQEMLILYAASSVFAFAVSAYVPFLAYQAFGYDYRDRWRRIMDDITPQWDNVTSHAQQVRVRLLNSGLPWQARTAS